jgi:hypothetical protein
MLEDNQSHGLTETEMAFLGGTFFAAGSDTVRCCFVASKDMRLKSKAQDFHLDMHSAHGSRVFPRGAS